MFNGDKAEWKKEGRGQLRDRNGKEKRSMEVVAKPAKENRGKEITTTVTGRNNEHLELEGKERN